MLLLAGGVTSLSLSLSPPPPGPHGETEDEDEDDGHDDREVGVASVLDNRPSIDFSDLEEDDEEEEEEEQLDGEY